MSRSDTRDITTFNLPFPDAATFPFLPPSINPLASNIRITVPESSRWYMPLHWHPYEGRVATCKKITCQSGFFRVHLAQGLASWNELGSTGKTVNLAPSQRVAFYRDASGPNDPLTVILEADHVLWRNICSAILDRDIFPELDTTPFWIKAMFTLLPFGRDALLSMMLQIQLLTIFAHHGVHLYHGYISVTWPWTAQPFGGRPPDWAKRLQLQSLYLIARVVMAASYRIGRVLLGMRGQYDEYTPQRHHANEKI